MHGANSPEHRFVFAGAAAGRSARSRQILAARHAHRYLVDARQFLRPQAPRPDRSVLLGTAPTAYTSQKAREAPGPRRDARMPRPKSYQTAATTGAGAADPFSSSDDDSQKDDARRRATSSATACGPCPARTGTASTAASPSAVLRVSAVRRSAAREGVLSRRAHGARGFLFLSFLP